MLTSYYYRLATAILLLSSSCYRHAAIVLSISSHPYHPATFLLISTSSCIPAAVISILSSAPCYLHSAIPKLLGLEYQWYSDNKDTSANCMWRIVTSIGNNTPTSQLEQWHSDNWDDTTTQLIHHGSSPTWWQHCYPHYYNTITSPMQ